MIDRIHAVLHLPEEEEGVEAGNAAAEEVDVDVMCQNVVASPEVADEVVYVVVDDAVAEDNRLAWEVVERVWKSSVGIPDRALRIGCTHIQVLELVSDEGRATVVAAGVALKVVLVTAESLVLLALRAGPAELMKGTH